MLFGSGHFNKVYSYRWSCSSTNSNHYRPHFICVFLHRALYTGNRYWFFVPVIIGLLPTVMSDRMYIDGVVFIQRNATKLNYKETPPREIAPKTLAAGWKKPRKIKRADLLDLIKFIELYSYEVTRYRYRYHITLVKTQQAVCTEYSTAVIMILLW